MNIVSVMDRPIVVDFAREPLSDLLVSEMVPIWEAHYDEIALHKDFPLSPIPEIYKKASDMKMLRIFTARRNGELVGYLVFFINQHPHYSTMTMASQDILYLSQNMRKGLIGYRFIAWCDTELQHEGVDVVFQHVKINHDFSPLLKRLGYQHQDTIYSRRLN